MSCARHHLYMCVALLVLAVSPLAAVTQLRSPVSQGGPNAETTVTSAQPTGPTGSNCTGCHMLDVEDVDLSSYVMYTSSTMNLRVDAQPARMSRACLVCHADPSLGSGQDAWAEQRLVLGNDLRNDHPISVAYDPTYDTGLRMASAGPDGREVGGLPLFEGKVECATCHEPHAGEHGALRMPNRGSALCLTCHIK